LNIFFLILTDYELLRCIFLFETRYINTIFFQDKLYASLSIWCTVYIFSYLFHHTFNWIITYISETRCINKSRKKDARSISTITKLNSVFICKQLIKRLFCLFRFINMLNSQCFQLQYLYTLLYFIPIPHIINHNVILISWFLFTLSLSLFLFLFRAQEHKNNERTKLIARDLPRNTFIGKAVNREKSDERRAIKTRMTSIKQHNGIRANPSLL